MRPIRPRHYRRSIAGFKRQLASRWVGGSPFDEGHMLQITRKSAAAIFSFFDKVAKRIALDDLVPSAS